MFENINKEILEQTIDLKGVGEGNKTFFSKDDSLPEIQKQGVFSLCKILSKPEQKFAYLADEVGLGKTYQAMGVISMLLRERENKEKPRILIIAPNTTVQKNWERELYLFSENNLVNREKRLFSRDDVKNFGNKDHALKKENSYRERLELRNAIESKKGIYWKTINIVKMTSFGSYAELLGISHIKEKGKVKYNLEKLLGALHQSIPENLEEKNVETEKAGIICGSYYNRKKPPKFDLIIIDEAQNLRNRNNQTTFLNSWLGLYRWADQPEIINCGTPHLLKDQDTKYLLLSATPTHRSKQTLSNVLEFFVSDKKKLENLQHDDIKNFLIRRLRTYEGKETKYDVRKQEGKDVFDNNNNLSELLEQKLMIALVQSRLAQFEDGKSNSTFKTGFLECFESFTPSEDTEVETAEDDPTGDPVEKKKGPFHEEKGNAPDKIVMAEIAENYENIMGKKPPHPKFNQTEKEICDLLNSENPEKCVIFVRRLASVRELQRRIIDIYEENIFDYWASRIIPRNSESEKKKITLKSLQSFFEKIYPRNEIDITEDDNDEDGQTSDGKKGDDNHDQKIVSQFMTWIAQKKKNPNEDKKNLVGQKSGFEDEKYSEVSKFKLSMANNKMNSYLFDENYFRSRFYKGNDKRYVREIESLFSKNFLKKINSYISSNPGELFFTKNKTQKRSNISALISALALKEKGLEEEGNTILAFYGIPKDVDAGTGKSLSEEDVKNFLKQTSLWNVFINENKVPNLNPDILSFNKREVLKIITEKAIKGSEYVLELLWAYCTEAKFTGDKKSISNPNDVVYQSVENLYQNPKFIRKINDLFNNADAVYKYSFGSETERITRVQLTKTYMASFNDQDWVKGSTGQGGNKDNEALLKRFNTPFYPDVIVCTDVLKEGINLHLFCNRIIHYGLAWTSGDLEQRVGRIDRFNSKAYRERKNEKKDTKINVEYPYMGKTIDETQLKNVLIQKTNNDVLMDTENGEEDRFIKFDKEDSRTVDEILKYFEKECEVSISPYDGEQFLINNGWEKVKGIWSNI